jgi:GT2 family glycosyltransferase
LEFNLRLKRAGWKIRLIPDIVFKYYPKSSFWDFFKHNIDDGVWAIYPIKFIKQPFQLRHYIPLLFVLSLIIFFISAFFFLLAKNLFILTLIIYLLVNLFFSLLIALKNGAIYFLLMPIAFICRHFGYGFGSIWGLIKTMI